MSTTAEPTQSTETAAIGRTLPRWCLTAQLSIDVTRAVIRRSQELRALGTAVGATKIYAASEWAQIEAVMKEREDRKARRQADGAIVV